jgi:ribonuclease I
MLSAQLLDLEFLEEADGSHKHYRKADKVVNAKDDPEYLKYDVYVFTVQWFYSNCVNNPSCMAKLKIPNIFTLHGLWPSFLSDKRLADCNTGPKISAVPHDKMREFMLNYWPTYHEDPQEFWDHEYNKHGYCYTERMQQRSYEPFLQRTIDLFQQYQMDQLMIQALGDVAMRRGGQKQFTYEDLFNLIQGARRNLYFDLACKRVNHKQYLEEIRFYFDLDFKPKNHHIRSNCSKTQPIIILFAN